MTSNDKTRNATIDKLNTVYELLFQKGNTEEVRSRFKEMKQALNTYSKPVVIRKS